MNEPYECQNPKTHIFINQHHWYEIKSYFLGRTQYRCANCNAKISKKEFQRNHYVLYEAIKRYE